MIGAAVLGALATVLAGREPGPLLDVLLIAGTAVATLVVALRSAYLIIPVPALAYVTAAIAAGLVHDRAADTSRTALTVSAVQWIASGFLAMSAATVLAIAIAAARRLRSSHGPRRPWPP